MSIETLNTLFYVFLILAIVFFLIAVVLFFVFDIKKIYLILSGKAEKLGVKKLQEESFKTGNLSKNNSANSVYSNTDSFAESGTIGATGRVTSSNTMRQASGISGHTSQSTLSGMEQTTLLGGNETTLLRTDHNNQFGTEETTMLSTDTTNLTGVGETAVLDGRTDVLGTQGTTMLNSTRRFVIIKKSILIHTEEVI